MEIDAAIGQSLGPPREFAGKYIGACSADGRLVCTVTQPAGAAVLRIFDRESGAQLGQGIQDQQVLEVPAELRSGIVIRVGFSADGALLQRDIAYSGGQDCRPCYSRPTPPPRSGALGG